MLSYTSSTRLESQLLYDNVSLGVKGEDIVRDTYITSSEQNVQYKAEKASYKRLLGSGKIFFLILTTHLRVFLIKLLQVK